MNDEITNIPKVRFKGYTEDWEQRKLGDVFEQTVEYIDPKEAGLDLWSVTVENGLTPKSERYNREFLVKKNDKFKAIHPNEIVYNPMNMTLGSVGFNNSGKDVAISGYYVTMKLKEEFDSNYFATWLPSPKAIGLYKLYATGSLIERQRVQFPTLSAIKTAMPSLEEQKKIGEFFKHLDNTITLHQRELDLLRKTKQTYLQKMFPKTGEDRPEIRFAGFTEPWEQRKLNEGMTEYTDRVYIQENKTYKQVSVKNIGKIVLRGEKKGIQIGRKRQAKVNLTDHPYTLIFTRQTIEQGGIGFAPKVTDGAIVTENMPTIDVNNDVINCNYLMAYVKTEDWYRNVILKNIEGGTAQVAIHEDNILSSEVHLPKIEEQQKIGTFFKQLDDTIALHQHDLNTLKEMKKSLLQQMFV